MAVTHLRHERLTTMQMRERWVSRGPGYTNALVPYVFYMFLRRRLKICHVFGAFYLQSRFLAPFFEGEGGVTGASVALHLGYSYSLVPSKMVQVCGVCAYRRYIFSGLALYWKMPVRWETNLPLMERKFSPYIDVTHQFDNFLLLLHINATSNRYIDQQIIPSLHVGSESSRPKPQIWNRDDRRATTNNQVSSSNHGLWVSTLAFELIQQV